MGRFTLRDEGRTIAIGKLIWAVAGLKLWRRHEAGLAWRWASSCAHAGNPSADAGNTSSASTDCSSQQLGRQHSSSGDASLTAYQLGFRVAGAADDLAPEGCDHPAAIPGLFSTPVTDGYIPPHFKWLHVRWLARLSLPGGLTGPDRVVLLSKVPLLVRVMFTSLYGSHIYG
eukprot:gene4183-4431_t